MKVFLKTYGCQMNVRDSEVVAGLLKKAGYKITDTESKADVVLLNTCSVRQHAEDKVWSQVGMLNKLTPKPIIGIIGCMAQNYKEEIFKTASAVDFVVGPSDIQKIPGIVKKYKAKGIFEFKVWETDSPNRPEEIYHANFYADKEHAYVVISEGCSNFCSYCVVPFVRGQLHNRPHQEILKEIKAAIDSGISKITLLGQNVNAYKNGAIDFIQLLKLVNEVKGLREFSFITSHPRDTSLELFKVMASLAKLKKSLHLPIQSGSDKVLKLMNRGYTRQHYIELIKSCRKIVKGAIITTDIIIGYPGESEKDFRDTYNLIKSLKFDAAFIFKYSPRPHSQALADTVPKEEKERRHKLILELQKKISRGKCKVFNDK